MKRWRRYWVLLFGLAVLLASPAFACEPPAPAEFEVVSLDIAPQEVAPGEEVIITAEVTNVGGRKGTHTVTLAISGVEETKVVKVRPGRTETVTFRVTDDSPGTWRVRVGHLLGTYRVLTPAEFTTSNLDITPPVAEVGETVTVTADVTNDGEIGGSYSATLTVDGSQVEAKELVVAAGGRKTVTFSFAEGAVGAHEVAVGELAGTLIVTEAGDALAELAAAYPQLCEELLKLPDLEEIDDRDKEAIEDIVELALNPKYEEAFESMLDEGIKDKRKYCSPLEALLWVAYDRELEGYYPLRPYYLGRLIGDVWKNTTTSKNYASERWQDFDEVVDRLSSPKLVAMYMKDNFSYDWDKYERWIAGDHRWDLALDTFEKKKSDCGGQAIFALHSLLQNGYLYDDFNTHTSNAACLLGCWDPSNTEKGSHTVLLYGDNDSFYTIDSGTTTVIKGPFTTIGKAADATFHGWRQYIFYDVNARAAKTVNR